MAQDYSQSTSSHPGRLWNKTLSHDARLAILNILDRYGKGATIITSQLPVDKWYEFINEPTTAEAILDRLTASAHRIELLGKSLRRKK